MTITYDGNVGIGTTDPGETLTVNGTSAITGNATVTGILEVGTTLSVSGTNTTHTPLTLGGREGGFEQIQTTKKCQLLLSLQERDRMLFYT